MFKIVEEAITIIKSMASTNMRGYCGMMHAQHKKGALELNSQEIETLN